MLHVLLASDFCVLPAEKLLILTIAFVVLLVMILVVLVITYFIVKKQWASIRQLWGTDISERC